MKNTRLCVVVGVALACSAGIAPSGGAELDAAGPCGDPNTRPLGSIYGGNRGTTWCNDGAIARATLGGKTYLFRGGVCYRDNGGFHVAIGTSIEGKRKKTDPAGFALNDFPAGGLVKDGVNFGLTTKGKLVSWSWGDVKVKVGSGKAPTGRFSGTNPVSKLSASGSFECKRVLRVPY